MAPPASMTASRGGGRVVSSEPELPAVPLAHVVGGSPGRSASSRTSSIDETSWILMSRLDVLGDVLLDGLLVALGQQDFLDAEAVRGQDLLLDAAHGQHAPGERHLAGHRHARAHGPAGEQRDDGGHERDAGRGAVLGDGALGHVQVQVDALEERVLDAELARVRPDPGQRGLGALLHHVAELAGEGEALLAEHLARPRCRAPRRRPPSRTGPWRRRGCRVRSSISVAHEVGRAQELLDLLRA